MISSGRKLQIETEANGRRHHRRSVKIRSYLPRSIDSCLLILQRCQLLIFVFIWSHEHKEYGMIMGQTTSVSTKHTCAWQKTLSPGTTVGGGAGPSKISDNPLWHKARITMRRCLIKSWILIGYCSTSLASSYFHVAAVYTLVNHVHPGYRGQELWCPGCLRQNVATGWYLDHAAHQAAKRFLA